MIDERRLDRLEEKQDGLVQTQHVIAVDLAEIKVDLKEHMRRTLATEENNTLLREYIDLYKLEVTAKMKPVETFIDRFKFVGWMIGSLSAGILLAEKLGVLDFLVRVSANIK